MSSTREREEGNLHVTETLKTQYEKGTQAQQVAIRDRENRNKRAVPVKYHKNQKFKFI
jgi:hypothetical protein